MNEIFQLPLQNNYISVIRPNIISSNKHKNLNSNNKEIQGYIYTEAGRSCSIAYNQSDHNNFRPLDSLTKLLGESTDEIFPQVEILSWSRRTGYGRK
jgi:hypothetical protein